MSDDNELENGPSHADDANHGVAPQQPDSPLPIDESEPRYDVSGAALGALASTEEADLYAAAAVDPSVSADLAAMEAVAAELARLAPAVLMNRGRSAGIRSRLVARAAATHAGRPVAKSATSESEQSSSRSAARSAAMPAHRPHTPASSGSSASSTRPVTGAHYIPFEPRSRGAMSRTIGTFAIAAAVLIAAFGIYTWRTQSHTGSAATASVVQDSSLEAQVASLRASVAQKDSLIAALTGMHTRVIDLVVYNNSADPMARVFWDQKTQMFIMYASNLKPPASGKTYQVWLIARGGAPVSAGTFMPDSAGSAVMATNHPMEPGTLRRIAVTEEPEGGVAAPTGPVMFAGVGR